MKEKEIEKYKKYKKASEEKYLNLYFNWICDYVRDSNIDYNNDDDIKFFIRLSNKSKYKCTYCKFYEYIIGAISCSENAHLYFEGIKILSQYSLFLNKVSYQHLEDLCIFLLKRKEYYFSDINFISDLLASFKDEPRLCLIKYCLKNPILIENIPKLKTYNLFS